MSSVNRTGPRTSGGGDLGTTAEQRSASSKRALAPRPDAYSNSRIPTSYKVASAAGGILLTGAGLAAGGMLGVAIAVGGGCAILVAGAVSFFDR